MLKSKSVFQFLGNLVGKLRINKRKPIGIGRPVCVPARLVFKSYQYE